VPNEQIEVISSGCNQNEQIRMIAILCLILCLKIFVLGCWIWSSFESYIQKLLWSKIRKTSTKSQNANPKQKTEYQTSSQKVVQTYPSKNGLA